ncbi:MAG: prepilin-type N-terminal cleavage/methylation domain-containing protein [Rhodospirillaceae bacterium]|nr:prepilin-type N-terminal cleavage/methylation domain-containing protein [Rhodospirillaceae bacterium]
MRGFTLIEIAIVLVVIGLVVSGGLLAVSPVVQSAKISETKQKMARVETALLAYVISNSCLPCPAVGATASGAANAGQSQNNTPGFYTTGCAAGCQLLQGVVPWNTLGIAEEEASDGWGRRFSYALGAGVTATSSMTRTTTLPTVTTSLTIQDPAGANLITTNVAYAIISHGVDGSFGFAVNTGAVLADRYAQGALGVGQDVNGENTRTVATGQVNNSNGTAYFDDLVTFRTAAQITLSCGAGSCGNPN